MTSAVWKRELPVGVASGPATLEDIAVDELLLTVDVVTGREVEEILMVVTAFILDVVVTFFELVELVLAVITGLAALSRTRGAGDSALTVDIRPPSRFKPNRTAGNIRLPKTILNK